MLVQEKMVAVNKSAFQSHPVGLVHVLKPTRLVACHLSFMDPLTSWFMKDVQSLSIAKYRIHQV